MYRNLYRHQFPLLKAMSENEYDPQKMFEDLKHLFICYEERKQKDFENEDNDCLAISGTYVLNRSWNNKIYLQNFRLGVVLTKPLPHVYILDDIKDIKKSGFDHFYKNDRCCLGTDVAVLLSWGTEYSTKTFFENNVDPFLINTISYKEEKYAVMGELKHGKKGMEEYYCELLGIKYFELRNAIFTIYRAILNKTIPINQTCFCKNNTFGNCSCNGKNVLVRMIRDQTLASCFYHDMRLIPWTKGIKYRKR